MRPIKFYFLIVAVSALLFTSCSKDEPDTGSAPEAEMVSLSLNGALQQFNKKATTKQGEETVIPLCNADSDPAYVKVAVEDSEGNWVNGNEFTTIPIIPVSIDSDGDGADNYLTFEAEELELEEGTYSIEYFGVYNSNDELIFLAPRGDEDYGPANFGDFVENPLPIAINLKEGTKHYVEVEVLCYDEAQARQYGYLFFDFEQVPLTYLCIFGNECDETGRHFPSNFRMVIWEQVEGSPEDLNRENALVNIVNIAERDGGDVVVAEPVCFPLPDRDGENMFYGEIYTIAADGSETLIRKGGFTDEQTKGEDFNIDNAENLRNYWHFREGPYCGEDSSTALFGDVEQECDLDAGEDNSGEFTRAEVDAGLKTLFLSLLSEGVSEGGTFEPPIPENSDAIGFGATMTTTYTVGNGDCKKSVDLTITVIDVCLPVNLTLAVEGENMLAVPKAEWEAMNSAERQSLFLSLLANGYTTEGGSIANTPIVCPVSYCNYGIRYSAGNGDCRESVDLWITVYEDVCNPIELGDDKQVTLTNSQFKNHIKTPFNLRIEYIKLMPSGVPIYGSFSPSMEEIVTAYNEDNVQTFSTTYTIRGGRCTDSVKVSFTVTAD